MHHGKKQHNGDAIHKEAATTHVFLTHSFAFKADAAPAPPMRVEATGWHNASKHGADNNRPTPSNSAALTA